MGSFIRYGTAKKSALYRMILRRVREVLTVHPYFECNAILKDLGLDVLIQAEAIRWDYIARGVQEGIPDSDNQTVVHLRCELIPLISAAFRRHHQPFNKLLSERYVVIGGRSQSERVAGYALVCPANEGLVVQWGMLKAKRVSASVASVNRTLDNATDAGVRKISPVTVHVPPRIAGDLPRKVRPPVRVISS